MASIKPPRINPALATELPTQRDENAEGNLGARHSEETGDARDDSSSAGNPSDEA